MLAKASALPHLADWLAVRVSYGMNGVLVRNADLPALADFLWWVGGWAGRDWGWEAGAWGPGLGTRCCSAAQQCSACMEYWPRGVQWP